VVGRQQLLAEHVEVAWDVLRQAGSVVGRMTANYGNVEECAISSKRIIW
jgi:hypothetical protein